MSHSCGGCQHFLKRKNDKYSGGLCMFLDARTNTDCGRKCEYWKARPYKMKIKRSLL